MTAYFANIQVQSDSPADVAEAVTALLARVGYEPEAELFGGDRSIYVGGGDRWTGVYDSAADGLSVGPLAWLAQGLSALLGAVTLAWLVHDSALVYLLFERGEVADRYISRPDVFRLAAGDAGPGPSPPLGGDGVRLLEVVGMPGNGRLLTRVLAEPAAFPQATLAIVAAALGQAHADLGHADIEEDLLGGGLLITRDDFTRLEFVHVGG